MGDSSHNLVIWQQRFMFEEKVPIKAKEAGVGASKMRPTITKAGAQD